MISKRGEGNESFSWIIGAIVGIMLASILGTVAIQWYLTTTKTEDSFDALIATIESLEDGKQTSMAYFLPEDMILISFQGEDFNTQRTTQENLFTFSETCDIALVQIPAVCGSEDCLCVCDTSYKVSYKDACTEDALACYPFTSEATKEFHLTDTECLSTGVYREGPSNGIFTLFLQRLGNEIKFCSTKECVGEEQKEYVEKTKELLTKYQSCMKKRDDCSCSLDFDYLTETDALVFSSDKVQLIEKKSKSVIYTETFATTATVKDSTAYTDTIALYNTQESVTIDNIDGVSQIVTSTLVSPSLENTESSIEVQEALYKKEGKMSFVGMNEDLSQVQSCEETEETRDPFANV